MCFLMSFRFGKKSTRNSKFQQCWQPIGFRLAILFGVGGRGGVPGKRKSSGYVAGEHSVKDPARRSEGGGGFKGYRLCRRRL